MSSPPAKTSEPSVATEAAPPAKGRRGKGPKKPVVPYFRLFRFATGADKAMYAIATIAGTANGIIFPVFTLIFGQLLDAFNTPNLSLLDEVSKFALYFFLIALGAGLATALEIGLPMICAERQMFKLRKEYFKALLRQDQGYNDSHRLGEVTARLSGDTMVYYSGIADKVTGTIHYSITFIAGLVIGFTKSWQLTLIIFAIVPFLVIIMGFLKKITETFESRVTAAYARAGDTATEVFTGIRTVAAYGGEESEVTRYDDHLEAAQKGGAAKGWAIGGAVGSLFGLMFMAYGVGTWVGTRLIITSREDHPGCRIDPTDSICFTGGTVITTFMAVIIGAFALGQAGPNFGSFGSAQAAAYSIFEVIDRVPTIDSSSAAGEKPAREKLTGRIEFRNVSFAYPTRPDEMILRNYNLVVEPGTALALVGESGCGKSTVLQLLQRFYDPLEGQVIVDGIDVKSWNIQHLRDMIGVVSQDPVLFGTTVRNNIAYGKAGLLAASDAEIVEASQAANAHEFIDTLPERYETIVGTSVSTTQLSGGQRQRICIARAIIRNPMYLFLDEATSALDTQSERVVQAALDKIMSDGQVKRTTIVIAHRLSTITNADRIVVMRKGEVIEDGTHDNLMALEKGTYRALRNLQDMHTQSAAIPGGATTAAVPSAAGAALSLKIPAGALSPDLKSPASPMSPTSKKQAEAAEEPDVPAPPVSRWRVLKLQLPEWPYILLGLFGAAVSGVVQPVFAIIYSEMIGIFFNPNDEFMKTESNKYIGAFFAIAVGHLIATVCRIGGFVHVGEVLTRRLRVLAFRALVRNEIGFFDDKKNSIGRLNTRLETDAADVRSGTGEALSMVFQAAAAILAGIIIAFIASWRLALVVCAILPFLIASSLMQGKAFKGFNIGAAKALEESGHIASESVAAIRTVASLNLQNQMVQRFQDSLVIPQKNGFSKAASAAAGQGFSQFVLFAGYAVAFYAGGHFMVDGVLDFTGMMRVFLALTMASQAAGNAINWAGNAAQAERARRAIFQILDRKSAIDPLSSAGIKPATGMKGRIEFRNVSFAYPSRKDRRVLTDFNLTIEPGQKVALVGPSGSGKSTVVQLLERFYDPAEGEILVDGVKLSDLNLQWLRNQMGIVQQEPALMADSIAYNIEYGRTGSKPPHDKGVPVDADAETVGTYAAAAPDVVAAAKSANALSFVEGFKNGFATHCGARGTQLSGGQKQRIAIARAVIRNPNLLLCDEATSALDSQSEAVVQTALDAILSSSGDGSKRTSIVIAHRLATIRDADKIVVVDRGTVKEVGTHEELMNLPDGLYRSLALAQDGVQSPSAAEHPHAE